MWRFRRPKDVPRMCQCHGHSQEPKGTNAARAQRGATCSPHTDPTGAGSATWRLENSDARPRTPLLKILQNFTWAMPFTRPNHPTRDAGVHREARLLVNSEVIAFQPPPAALPGSQGTQANTVRKVRTCKETTFPPCPLPEKKKKSF